MTAQFQFYNNTSYTMTITPPTDVIVSVPAGGNVGLNVDDGDFTISYNSNSYKLSGKALQKYPHTYYRIGIQDSIILGDPVSSSQVCTGTVCSVVSAPASWDFHISFPDKIIISDVQTDASDNTLGWKQMPYDDYVSGDSLVKKHFWIWILVILAVVIAIIIGVVMYMKRDTIRAWYL